MAKWKTKRYDIDSKVYEDTKKDVFIPKEEVLKMYEEIIKNELINGFIFGLKERKK